MNMDLPESQVLLVEDDPRLPELLRALLHDDNIKLTCAKEAVAALKLAREGHFDLILLDLGLAHGMRYDYEAAQRCLDKAIRIAPKKAAALTMAGTHCRNFGRYEMARHYFERAIDESCASPDSLVKLAEIYERFRLLEEASKLVDRALQMDSGCVLALLVRARLDRLAGRLDQAESALRPLLGQTDPNSWSTRIRGWYELAAILDRRGRYDEAIQAVLDRRREGLHEADADSHVAQIYLDRAKKDLANREKWAQQAAFYFDKAAALAPGDPFILENAMDGFNRVGDYSEKGCPHYEKAVGFGEAALALLQSSTVSVEGHVRSYPTQPIKEGIEPRLKRIRRKVEAWCRKTS